MSDQQEPILHSEQQTQQQNKQQEKPTLKKEHSYTYWVDEKNKSRTLPPEQRPQKIDPPKLINQKSDDGRSDWNTAGTWQHKKVSLSDIQKIYAQRLNQWTFDNAPNTTVKKVELNGECEVIFTSKKKALTYEINGKVEFQKKTPEQEKPQKSVQQTSQDLPKDDLSSGSDNSGSVSSEEVSLEKEDTSKSTESIAKNSETKKKKSKPQTMTLEIVDLTDHGDREFKSKADNAEGKKFMAEKSESLLGLLEEILKSYK